MKNDARKHFSHLPSSQVLDEALRIEAKREIPEGKQNSHFPKFNLFLSWLKAIEVDTDFFENPEKWNNLIDSGNEIRKTVAQFTIEQVDKNNQDLIAVLKSIEEYLGAEHLIPENIDLLFIFGSKDLGRVRKASEIFHSHNVKKVLITGGSRYDSEQSGLPEAQVFKEEALRLGIPENKIIIEPNSITIADNVRSGLNLLDELSVDYKNIVTMVSWFAQRRAWSHLSKYTSSSVDIICVNSDPKSIELSPGSWFKHEIGINVVFSEFIKMKMAVMIDTA